MKRRRLIIALIILVIPAVLCGPTVLRLADLMVNNELNLNFIPPQDCMATGYAFVGTVVDQSKQPIADAEVAIRSRMGYTNGEKTIYVRSDYLGQFDSGPLPVWACDSLKVTGSKSGYWTSLQITRSLPIPIPNWMQGMQLAPQPTPTPFVIVLYK